MRTTLMTLAGALMWTVLAGCDGEPADPPDAGGAGNGIQPAAKPSIDAEAVINKQCTRCHGLDRVETHHFDRAGWEKTIAQMVTYGATLTAEERAAVIDYLTKRDAGATTAPHHDDD